VEPAEPGDAREHVQREVLAEVVLDEATDPRECPITRLASPVNVAALRDGGRTDARARPDEVHGDSLQWLLAAYVISAASAVNTRWDSHGALSPAEATGVALRTARVQSSARDARTENEQHARTRARRRRPLEHAADDPREERDPSARSIAAAPAVFADARATRREERTMTTMTMRDGTEIFYKDWGTGQPVVFSHGWPLTADAWDAQMVFLGERGHRVVAHDRRGHGRSSQTWAGNDMDTYADDLAEIIEGLELRDVILIGHSTGGGEVTRYVGRHGTDRIAKIVLLGAIPPLMLKTDANPKGLPLSVFDEIRENTRRNRSQYFKDLAIPFYGYNRKGAELSQGVVDAFWLQSMLGGIKGELDCIKQFSETDFTEDLKKFDVPTLIVHGDDDQIVPIGASALESAKLVKDATLKVYRGAPHGLATTRADELNADLLEFIQAGASYASVASSGQPLAH
jgi:non-heme chloroperoxidase